MDLRNFGSYYGLSDYGHTLIWRSDREPSNYAYDENIKLYTDANCTTLLTTAPAVGTNYYACVELWNTRPNDHTIDFSQMGDDSTLDLSLLGGYIAGLHRVNTFVNTDKCDSVQVIFKVSKISPEPYYLAQVNATATGVGKSSSGFYSLSDYQRTLHWYQRGVLGYEPSYYLGGGGNLYTDADCTTPLTTAPAEGSNYYVRLSFWNNRENDHSIEFSRISGEKSAMNPAPGYSTLDIPGYTATFHNKKIFIDKYGCDHVHVIFEVAKNKSEYIITFNANGGEGFMSPKTAFEGNYTLPACSFTPPSGMRFLKWDKGDPGETITVSGDTEIKALWTADVYEITYKPGEGSGSESTVTVDGGKQYTVGSVYTEFTAPGGKMFLHYQINSDPNKTCLPGDRITIREDTTLTAIWSTQSSVIHYVVKYEKNGGSGEEKTYNIMVENHKMALSENWFVPPADHTFKCWDVNGSEKDPYDTITVNTNITIKPVWRELQDRTISFNMNGHGTAIAPKTVKEGKPLSNALPTPAPTEEGFIFEGWYWEAECVNRFSFNDDVPATDVTVYAKWSEQIKKVQIDGLKEPVGGEYAIARHELSIPTNAPYLDDAPAPTEDAEPSETDGPNLSM